jgi:hypothetical protein
LTEQLEHRSVLEPSVPALTPTRSVTADLPTPLPLRELIFPNGFGGFTRDGDEYVITLLPGQMTPAPWVNVLANPWFGTVISESGAAYTWVENSHEFRLTPWSNDPVQDTTGEAFYIRDEQTGQFWSPTPLPARGATPYVIRHGFGYTVFEHTENGIASELWVYVAMDAPVKFAVTEFTRRPDQTMIGGTIENRGTTPKTYTVNVEFLDKTGTVVSTETATVGPVAPKKSSAFKITSAKGGVYGYRYKPIT